MSETLCIIGNKGRMGKMLSQRLGEEGFNILGIDIKDEGANDKLTKIVSKARAVVLALPAKEMEGNLKFLCPHLTKGQILMDICSVKSLPMKWMEGSYEGPVIGTHPLFGPQAHYSDMRVALVKGKNAKKEDADFVEALFKGLDCTVIWTSAEEHDSGVALSQSLNFAISAAFLDTIGDSPKAYPFLTPSFKRHLTAARGHFTEDSEMFVEFSALNPYFSMALEKFITKLGGATNGGLENMAKNASSWYRHSIS